MIAANIVQWAIGVTAVATALITLAAAVEKVFSPAGKWLQRWLVTPMAAEMAKLNRTVNSVNDRQHLMADDVAEMRRALEEHRRYTFHHLGPNGDTTPVYKRLQRIEEAHNIEDPT